MLTNFVGRDIREANNDRVVESLLHILEAI